MKGQSPGVTYGLPPCTRGTPGLPISCAKPCGQGTSKPSVSAHSPSRVAATVSIEYRQQYESDRMHGTVPSAASKGQHGSVRCHGSVAHGTADSMPAKDAQHVGMTSHGNMPTNHLHALWVDRRAGKCVPDDADDGSARLPQRQYRGNDGGNLHAAVPRRWLGAAEKCQEDSQALQ